MYTASTGKSIAVFSLHNLHQVICPSVWGEQRWWSGKALGFGARGPGFDSRSHCYNFRDWLSPTSKSWYGWTIAKSNINPQSKQPNNPMSDNEQHPYLLEHYNVYWFLFIGMWADSDDDENAGFSGGSRRRKKNDLTMPVNFVSGGIKQGDKIKKEKENETVISQNYLTLFYLCTYMYYSLVNVSKFHLKNEN